jgi:predicted DNA-binding mobile mystery protein A
MNIVKKIASEQYKDLVNKVAKKMRTIQIPTGGWIFTIRNALGMSATQLAGRISVTRQNISLTEKNELSGSVTLKTMQTMAEGMGCRFVYAIVPKNRVEDILAERAKIRATRIVKAANKHMALEGQALTKQKIASEIERLQNELLKEMPPGFWKDEV